MAVNEYEAQESASIQTFIFNVQRKCNVKKSYTFFVSWIQKAVWRMLDILLHNLLNIDIFLNKRIASEGLY